MKDTPQNINEQILEIQRFLKERPSIARREEEHRIPWLPFVYRVPVVKDLPLLYKYNDQYRAIWAQSEAKYLTCFDKDLRLKLKEKIQGDIDANKRFRINFIWTASLFTLLAIGTAGIGQLASLSISAKMAQYATKQEIERSKVFKEIERSIVITGNIITASVVLGLCANVTTGIGGHCSSQSIVNNSRFVRILEYSLSLTDEDS